MYWVVVHLLRPQCFPDIIEQEISRQWQSLSLRECTTQYIPFLGSVRIQSLIIIMQESIDCQYHRTLYIFKGCFSWNSLATGMTLNGMSYRDHIIQYTPCSLGKGVYWEILPQGQYCSLQFPGHVYWSALRRSSPWESVPARFPPTHNPTHTFEYPSQFSQFFVNKLFLLKS